MQKQSEGQRQFASKEWNLVCFACPFCRYFSMSSDCSTIQMNIVEPPATFPTEVPTLLRGPGPTNGLCISTPGSPLVSQRRIRSHFVGGLIHRRRVSVLSERGGFLCATSSCGIWAISGYFAENRGRNDLHKCPAKRCTETTSGSAHRRTGTQHAWHERFSPPPGGDDAHHCDRVNAYRQGSHRLHRGHP